MGNALLGDIDKEAIAKTAKGTIMEQREPSWSDLVIR